MNAPKGMTAVESGEHMGIKWCIVAAPIAAGNGYVFVPEGHCWEGRDVEDVAEVHGGITYGGVPGWIGFDTLHSGDYWPEQELARLGGEWSDYRPGVLGDLNHWTVESLIAETKRLAAQVAGASWL